MWCGKFSVWKEKIYCIHNAGVFAAGKCCLTILLNDFISGYLKTQVKTSFGARFFPIITCLKRL